MCQHHRLGGWVWRAPTLLGADTRAGRGSSASVSTLARFGLAGCASTHAQAQGWQTVPGRRAPRGQRGGGSYVRYGSSQTPQLQPVCCQAMQRADGSAALGSIMTIRIHMRSGLLRSDGQTASCGVGCSPMTANPRLVTCRRCRGMWDFRAACQAHGLVEVSAPPDPPRWMPASEAITEALRTRGPATARALARWVGVTPRRVRQVLTQNPAYQSEPLPSGKGPPMLWSLRA